MCSTLVALFVRKQGAIYGRDVALSRAWKTVARDAVHVEVDRRRSLTDPSRATRAMIHHGSGSGWLFLV